MAATNAPVTVTGLPLICTVTVTGAGVAFNFALCAAVTEAQTISCGDLTITHDGVQQP